MVDTNVLVVADERHPEAAPECVLSCVEHLQLVQTAEYVLDEAGVVLDEYHHNTRGQRPYTVGYQFVLHVYQTQADPSRCVRMVLTPHADRQWEEFPDAVELASLGDRSDRVFAALARTVDDAEVANAVDSDWWIHREALERHGIQVQFLCPDAMPRQP